MRQLDLNELFDIESFKITEIVVKQKPSRLDPINDIKAGNVRVDYKPRYGKTTIPFMDFAKGDRRWLDLLVTELVGIADVYRADKIIMLDYAAARRGTGSTQTWQKYVEGLYSDKVLRGMDYTTSQLKHLPTLIDLLRQGECLKGCGSLEFCDLDTGKTL